MQDVANVVWCTGFRPDFSWVQLPAFNDKGEPAHRRGVVEDVEGLYFLGLDFLYAASSAMVQGVGRDASFIVKQVSRRYAARQSASVAEPASA